MLRSPDVDETRAGGFTENVAKRRSRPSLDGEKDKDLDDLLAEIRAAWSGTDADLAKAGGVAESTWHAWRRRAKGLGGDSYWPKYRELREVAKAAGFDVRPRRQDGSQAQPGRSTLKIETREVVEMMERLPDEQRAAIKKAALDKVLEFAARPPEAVAEEEGHRGRAKSK